MFSVLMLSHNEVVFEGKAESVVLPGDTGEFEILDFHHDILSLLAEGNIIIDGVNHPVKRGIARFDNGCLTALVER